MSDNKILSRMPLALKYRPKKLKHLVGQPHIVNKIKSIIQSRNIPNAILLTGLSGSGKTTTARMIARYVNCDTLNACGKCAHCVSMNGTSPTSVSYLEVNAGASGGIDNIRDLLRQSKFRPSIGNMRIIMIDEAHRLTSQAQQAFLKDLEEPSEQTLWILGSMEPEKLLPALVNRCMHCVVQPISVDDMFPFLMHVLEKEGFVEQISEDTVNMICQYSQGSMRMALQLLDSAIRTVQSHGNADAEELAKMVTRELESDDDVTAGNITYYIWTGQSSRIPEQVLNIEDTYRMCNKLIEYSLNVMYDRLGTKSRKLWRTPAIQKTISRIDTMWKEHNVEWKKSKIGSVSDILAELNELRSKVGTASLNETSTFVCHLVNASMLARRLFA